MLWGFSLQFWQVVVFWLWAASAVGGGVAVVAALGSSVISYYITDATESAAKIEIGNAKATASRADEAAANANERAAQTELALEQERSQRLELQRKVLGRRLSEEQKKTIVEYLRSDAITVPVMVWTVKGDNEALFYAADITDCLKEAGINAGGPHGAFEQAFGTGVAQGSGEQGQRLIAALTKAGVEINGGEFAGVEGSPEMVFLKVGSKLPQ